MTKENKDSLESLVDFIYKIREDLDILKLDVDELKDKSDVSNIAENIINSLKKVKSTI